MRNVLENGHKRDTRSGEVRSIFGGLLEHDMNDGFPLLTTKRVFWRGVKQELFWFLKGRCTHNKDLLKQKVHIWDGNSTRDYLDRKGLTEYEEGELGPIYGY